MTHAQRLHSPLVPQAAARPFTLSTGLCLAVALGLLLFVAVFVSLPVAGGLFAIGFVLLTSARPDLALLVMFLTVPFVWSVGGGGVNLAASDVSLMLAFPVLFLRAMSRRMPSVRNPLWIPIAGYFAVCVAATVANGGMRDSVTSMVQMIVYMVVAVYVFSSCIEGPQEVRLAFYGLLAADVFLALNLVATGSNYVMGLHKNASGTQLGIGVLIATELWLAETDRRRKRILAIVLAVIAAGLAFSLSRGAWTGTAAGIFLILTLRGQLKTAAKLMLMLVPVVGACWLALPSESKDYVGDISMDAHNVKTRLASIDLALDYFRSSPVIGVGVGLRKMYDATNVVLSTLAETGAVGLAAFLSIFATFSWMVWRASRRLPVRDPSFSLLTIGAALMLSKFLHGCVDHYWSRGILPVWAGAGLAVYAYSRSRAAIPNKRPS